MDCNTNQKCPGCQNAHQNAGRCQNIQADGSPLMRQGMPMGQGPSMQLGMAPGSGRAMMNPHTASERVSMVRPDMMPGSGQRKSPNMTMNPGQISQPDTVSGRGMTMRPGMPVPGTAVPSANIDQYPVAMAYVPWQRWQQVYPVDKAMSRGTIFPDLDKPFSMGRCR